MIVKKYKAPTETDAILLAKEELGSQAVVLNVKTIKPSFLMRLFKKEYVEITAALEEKDFAANVNEKKPTFSVPANKTSTIDVVADDMRDRDIPQKSTAIEAKLDSLHTLLKEQMKEQLKVSEENKVSKENEGAQQPAETEENANMKYLKLIYNRLIDNEVDEKYVNGIIEEIEGSLKKEATLDNIISAVYQKIILKLDEPKPITFSEKNKIVVFVGPTGVGKTTTIAKLASKLKITEQKKVAFITSDTYRIAAVEQLNTYASILGIPVKVVYGPSEMEAAIEEYKKYDVIFIDTAGRSHKNEAQKDELVNLLERIDNEKYDVEKFLCLSATTKYKDLVNIVDAFSVVGDTKLIFTKLDETMCLGNILNMKLYTGAPISYIAVGQNVPDDIEEANVQRLAKQLLGGNES